MNFGLASHRSTSIWVKMGLALAKFGNIYWFQNNDMEYYWGIQTDATISIEG